MVRYDTCEVRFAMYFDVVSRLHYVYTIEALDDTEIIQWVGHVALDFLAYGLAVG